MSCCKQTGIIDTYLKDFFYLVNRKKINNVSKIYTAESAGMYKLADQKLYAQQDLLILFNHILFGVLDATYSLNSKEKQTNDLKCVIDYFKCNHNIHIQEFINLLDNYQNYELILQENLLPILQENLQYIFTE